MRETLASIDPSLPVFRFGSLQSILAESLIARKGLLLLSLLMGTIAMLLAAIGIYGSAAFRLSLKLREFAIRSAIGAKRTLLIRTSVGYDLKLASIGLVLGVLLSLAGSRLVSSWLYGVDAYDPTVFASLALLVLLVNFLSSYLPAKRSIREENLKL